MASDPATEECAAMLSSLYELGAVVALADAEHLLSIIAPLIRRQAFDEAAAAVEDYCNQHFASDDPADPWPVAALVRGLGEKEN